MLRSKKPQQRRAWKIGKKFSRKPPLVGAFIHWKPNGSKSSVNLIGSGKKFILNTFRRSYRRWRESKRQAQHTHPDLACWLLRCPEKILQGHRSSTYPYEI